MGRYRCLYEVLRSAERLPSSSQKLFSGYAKRLSGKRLSFIGRKPLTQISHENITQALNELKHEVLSHQVFLGCFSSAVKSGEIKGFDKIFSLQDDSGLLSIGSRSEGEVPEGIRKAIEEEEDSGQ